MERASRVVPVPQAGAAGRGGSIGSTVLVLAGDEHMHRWRRLPESVGLFVCGDRGCAWFAVCPACLGSLDVALSLRDGMDGLALYWCAAHDDDREGG